MRNPTKAELQETNSRLSNENTMLRQVLSDMIKSHWSQIRSGQGKPSRC